MYLLYGSCMDPEMVAEVRRANEACVALLTLLIADDVQEAARMALTDPVYSEAKTSMAIASIAISAIKALAETYEVPAEEIVQVIGLGSAELVIDLEKRIDP